MKKLLSALMLLLSLLAFGEGNADNMKALADRFGAMYFAPMAGLSYFRLYDPATGIVEFRAVGNKGVLQGAGGWSGKLRGNAVDIAPPDARKTGVVFHFANGSPDMVTIGEARYKCSPDEVRPAIKGKVPVLWQDEEEVEGGRSAWRWKGRLAWPYVNPNCASVLYGMLALVALACFCYAEEKRKIIGSAVVLSLAALAVAATQSRGGFLALGIGSAMIVASRFVRPGARKRLRVLLVLGALAVVAALLFLTLSFGDSLNFAAKLKSMGTGDSLRGDILTAATRMMVDAPWGWRFIRPGYAFMNWYQPLDSSMVTWTLVSGHLTALVAMGWIGRFLWLAAWLGLPLTLLVLVRKGLSPLPAALWTTLAVAAVFNPVLTSWSLWLLPVASLALVAKIDWKKLGGWSWKPALGAVLGAVALCGLFFVVGSKPLPYPNPHLIVKGDSVLVNGINPEAWVVDDEETLGWLMAGKEMRIFCNRVPHAGAMGYTKDLQEVPATVRRLLVARGKCREYLDLWSKGQAPKAKELVFISPDIPPSEIPERLRSTCSFMMILGEFATRYREVYGNSEFPDWVGTVDGAEIYIPGWVSLVNKR